MQFQVAAETEQAMIERKNALYKLLTSMLICKHYEAVGNISSPVKTHYFCFHVSIGSLQKKDKSSQNVSFLSLVIQIKCPLLAIFPQVSSSHMVRLKSTELLK